MPTYNKELTKLINDVVSSYVQYQYGELDEAEFASCLVSLFKGKEIDAVQVHDHLMHLRKDFIDKFIKH